MLVSNSILYFLHFCYILCVLLQNKKCMQKYVKILYIKRQEMRSKCILILLCNFVLTFSYRQECTMYFQITYCFIEKAHNNHSKSLLHAGCIFFLFRKKYPILSKYVSRVTVWISSIPVEKSCKKLNHKYGFTIGLVYIIQTFLVLPQPQLIGLT